MSTSKRPSMRSKVEKRMQRESGKTLKEIRRAQKLKKKIMTEEERLIYNLRRAKKKVALLLQKLKKYELPELPPSRHDPELLTPEQLQAYKKIGFRNKNYVPVGVRGVFGGVVQNMHLHWKFHETVQVCCDNFPKEKIKEMATMLARLSGGIVINIHNVKTIIMFRGRNYRQPKILIPVNTLTKRKALFKARFEQALESQKLNIKKIEQQLRRKGINPDDPVAMASLHKVASTFFNALDKKDGSPFMLHGEEEPMKEPRQRLELSEPVEDSDREELDKFIAEIEDAVDKEWTAEEAAEKEELGKIRYWNKEGSGGRFKPDHYGASDSDDEFRGGARGWKDSHQRQRIADSEDEDDGSESDRSDLWELSHEDGANDDENHSYDSNEHRYKHPSPRVERWEPERSRGSHRNQDLKETHARFRGKTAQEESESEKTFSDLDDIILHSDSEGELSGPQRSAGDNEDDYDPFGEKKINTANDAEHSEFDSDDFDEDVSSPKFGVVNRKQGERGRADPVSRNVREDYNRKWAGGESEDEGDFSDSEIPMLESDDDDELSALRGADDDYSGIGGTPYDHSKDEDSVEQVSRKRNDENWDSD